MITPKRLIILEGEIVDSEGRPNIHLKECAFDDKHECDCVYGVARELLSELKDSLVREKKNREEMTRFASRMTSYLEDQIKVHE